MPTSETQGIIILGVPRSGTTLLRRLLDAHPALCCPGETFLFRGCARFLEHDVISSGFDYGVLGALEGLGYQRGDVTARLRRFVTQFYEELAQKAGKPRWAAKTAVDSFYLPQIEELFTGHARFICLTRHGLDVVCSMDEFSRDLQTYISEIHDYTKRYPRPFEAFAHAWADVTGALLDFAQRHKSDCHQLRYEDLVKNPDSELKKITDFLKLPALPKAADILANKTLDGIGDWKSYKKTKMETAAVGRWSQQLPDATIEALAPIVNPALVRAGYEAVSAGSAEDQKRRQELARMMMQARDA